MTSIGHVARIVVLRNDWAFDVIAFMVPSTCDDEEFLSGRC
ncbi:MAG: hypothetical protein R3C10_05520 [Pirellulales bacterium]